MKHEKAKKRINKELMKLVPEGYKIHLLPCFFNHIDGERICTVLRDRPSDFILNTPKKVMFTCAAKVFAYNSEVNSVRCVLGYLHKEEGAEDEEPDEEDDAAEKKEEEKVDENASLLSKESKE